MSSLCLGMVIRNGVSRPSDAKPRAEDAARVTTDLHELKRIVPLITQLRK